MRLTPELKLATIFVVAALALLVGLHWQFVMIHVSQETGTSNASSRAYDFWSGFGSDIAEIALLGGLWHMINCHTPGCKRLQRHTTTSGSRLCRRCFTSPPHPELPAQHPGHDVDDPPSVLSDDRNVGVST